MTATVIYAPQQGRPLSQPSVFLAGSIEMGIAEDWQTRLTNDLGHLPITIFNPRRPDWDSSWKQTKDDPQFRQQVEWELTHLARATIIALYFDPVTKSPISLLELGLFANTNKVIICCPEGFWRKGNVDIVAERWGIAVYGDYETFAKAVRERLEWRHLS